MFLPIFRDFPKCPPEILGRWGILSISQIVVKSSFAYLKKIVTFYRTARIWDVESGKELRRLEGHSGHISSVAFSSDGKRIVSSGGGYSGDTTIRIWDTESGEALKVLSGFGHMSQVDSVSFSPDGERVISSHSDGTARIWDVESGGEWKHLRGVGGSAVFSPDGKRVVTAGGSVRVWTLE